MDIPALDRATNNLELALLRVDCWQRRWQLNAIAELAISASDYSALRSQYWETIYLACLSYLVQSEARSTSFKADVGRAVVEAFPDAFGAGYTVNGEQPIEPDDDAWLTARITAEVGHVDLLFQNLKVVKDEPVAPSIYVEEANKRADGYAQTLDAVFAEGRLRGARNVMLTLDGVDGQESCRDCQRLKGQRHRAKWWAEKGLIPGQPGNENYECRGYHCQHRLYTDGGEVWTF